MNQAIVICSAGKNTASRRPGPGYCTDLFSFARNNFCRPFNHRHMKYYRAVAHCLVFFLMPVLSLHSQQVAIADYLYPVESPVLSGFIAAKLEGAYQHRLLEQDADRLLQPFRNRTETSCWQSEFWGKWFTSALLAYRYQPKPELKKMLDSSVAGLMATQTADGYIGNYTTDKHLQQWDIWGRKYCMLGLIGYYDLTKRRAVLDAASRMADHLIKELSATHSLIVKMGNHRGMAASSVLEPIVLLYVRTADKRYLHFAEEIVREWETADGPQLLSKSITPVGKRFPKPVHSWYGWEQGQKAYEMMSCYEGLLELYRVTGNAAYKRAVENTWESIHATELNIAGSGSAMECWFGGAAYQTLPVNHYQETCVTATWIKLSQQLFRLTGQAKYADAIEQTYYNALLGSMYNDGSDWAKYSPLSGERLKGEQQCGMGINCCEASGPRGLFTLPLTAVMKTGNGISVNFYLPGTFSIQSPARQPVVIEQSTDYPVSGKIMLKLSLAKTEKFMLRIRIPAWSKASQVSLPGEPRSLSDSAGFVWVNREWKDGDIITVYLDMRGRLLTAGTHREYFAIARGPLVLARDARLGGPDTDAPLTPVLTKDGFVDLQPAAGSDSHYWLEQTASFITESHAEGGPTMIRLSLCDYASAGKTFDPLSRFRVWLPALVESPGLP